MDASKLIELKGEEQVLLTVHGSLIPLWSKILLAFVWLVLPFFLLFPLFRMHLLGIIIFLLLLFSALLYAYRTFQIWHDSVFLVTDRRLVDMDRRGLWARVVSEVSYPDVEDVSYAIDGLFATIFRYGTLTVQMAGNAVELQVYNVRHPAKVHNLINDLRREEKEKHVSLN